MTKTVKRRTREKLPQIALNYAMAFEAFEMMARNYDKLVEKIARLEERIKALEPKPSHPPTRPGETAMETFMRMQP